MELKHEDMFDQTVLIQCLNRTFYGIETICNILRTYFIAVLIVPFMELKPLRNK